jgi:Holliday junction resolvase
MSNDQETSIVINTLTKDMGFEAERIPEQPQAKRADIRARKGKDYFLFEVKSREDHPALMAYIENAQAHEEAEYCEELKRRSAISSDLKNASHQLAETPKPNREFSCVWFRIIEQLITDGSEFIQTSLYGIKYLLISDSETRRGWAKCYYFDYNDFYNYKNINAVILDNGREMIRLCVNNYADAINQFRNSELYRYFKNTDRIIDPITFDLDSGFLVADIDCPRREEDKVKEYVEKKYRIKVITIFDEMKSRGGIVKLPQ